MISILLILLRIFHQSSACFHQRELNRFFYISSLTISLNPRPPFWSIVNRWPVNPSLWLPIITFIMSPSSRFWLVPFYCRMPSHSYPQTNNFDFLLLASKRCNVIRQARHRGHSLFYHPIYNVVQYLALVIFVWNLKCKFQILGGPISYIIVYCCRWSSTMKRH